VTFKDLKKRVTLETTEQQQFRLFKGLQNEKIIFDSLATENGDSNSSSKHVWIKKATGLGISELFSVSWPGFA
jgi:hypothetical protein